MGKLKWTEDTIKSGITQRYDPDTGYIDRSRRSSEDRSFWGAVRRYCTREKITRIELLKSMGYEYSSTLKDARGGHKSKHSSDTESKPHELTDNATAKKSRKSTYRKNYSKMSTTQILKDIIKKEQSDIDDGYLSEPLDEFGVTSLIRLKVPKEYCLSDGPSSIVVTKEILTPSLFNALGRRGITGKNLNILVDYIFTFFGFDDEVIDNRLTTNDRDVFYMLEEENVIKAEWAEVSIQRGKVWRLHYWVWNKPKIVSLIDDYKKSADVPDEVEDKTMYDDFNWDDAFSQRSGVSV